MGCLYSNKNSRGCRVECKLMETANSKIRISFHSELKIHTAAEAKSAHVLTALSKMSGAQTVLE